MASAGLQIHSGKRYCRPLIFATWSFLSFPRCRRGWWNRGQPCQTEACLRDGNLAILTYVSIGANTFPSGHAAASVAVALVLLQFAPVSGAVFMFLAISINIASVAQRYHYTLDCLLGALVALLVFAVTGS